MLTCAEALEVSIPVLPDKYLMAYIKAYEGGPNVATGLYPGSYAHCAIGRMLKNEFENVHTLMHRFFVHDPAMYKALRLIEAVFEGWAAGRNVEPCHATVDAMLISLDERKHMIYEACLNELHDRYWVDDTVEQLIASVADMTPEEILVEV